MILPCNFCRRSEGLWVFPTKNITYVSPDDRPFVMVQNWYSCEGCKDIICSKDRDALIRRCFDVESSLVRVGPDKTQRRLDMMARAITNLLRIAKAPISSQKLPFFCLPRLEIYDYMADLG